MKISYIGPKVNYIQGNKTYKIRKNTKGIQKQISFKSDISEHSQNDITIIQKPIPKKETKLEEGQILDKDNNVFNRSSTYFFRLDLDWSDFGKYLKEKFKTLNNVGIYCFGCSSGDEAYSLALLIKDRFGNIPFTIKASDISSETIENNIEEQKSGITISNYNYSRVYNLLHLTTEKAKKYFEDCSSRLVKIKPDIVDHVEFEHKNILKAVNDIDETCASIILCRNMWPYINPDKYNDFAKELYKKLAPGSIVVIGEFDCCGDEKYPGSDGFPKALLKNKFKPVKRGISLECSIYDKDRVLIYKK